MNPPPQKKSEYENPPVGTVNPVRDKEVIDTELQLKDLDSVEKKISK